MVLGIRPPGLVAGLSVCLLLAVSGCQKEHTARSQVGSQTPPAAPAARALAATPTAGAPQAATADREAVQMPEHESPAAAPVVTAAPEPNRAPPAGTGAARPRPSNGGGPLPPEPNEAGRQACNSSDLTAFYEGYAAILKNYVGQDSLVDYSSLSRRRLDLKGLLAILDNLDPNVYQAWPGADKLAFWLNAYNVKMLETIARNYPIQSSRWLRLTWAPSDIRHIKGLRTDYKFIVMDEEFTLAAVEQRFFDRTFRDPRVYLALAYATRSGPPLRREPYRGEDLDRQLDEQVGRFLSSPRGLQIDRRNMVVRLSAIFKPTWRGQEFVGRYGTDKKFKDRDPPTRAVLNFVTHYLSQEDISFLEVENYTIEYMNFDWRLNDGGGGY